MTKMGAKDLDNVTRLIARLPADEAARVLRDLKTEKNPEGKRKIINKALEKSGLKPL